MSKTLQKQNFTSLLRRVRAILPGNVKKTDTLEYEVDGKVKINFNYYCRWSGKDLDKELKECHPVSIRISPASTYLESQVGYRPSNRKVFVTRTIPRQKVGGDFNLESIAVAVTRGIEAVDKFVSNIKASEAKQEADLKIKEKEISKLEKELKPFGLEKQFTGHRIMSKFRTKNGVVDIDVYGPGDTGEFRYNVMFDALNREQLTTILQAVRIASGFPAEIDED